MSVINFEKYQKNLNKTSTVRIKGRVTELVGLVAKAAIPNVKVGELCLIETDGGQSVIKAEVVGFKENEVLLMPLGNLEGIAPGSEVTATGDCLKVPVGMKIRGLRLICNRGGSGTITMTTCKRTLDAKTTLDTTIVSTGTGWTSVATPSLAYRVELDYEVYINIDVTASSILIGYVAVDFALS